MDYLLLRRLLRRSCAFRCLQSSWSGFESCPRKVLARLKERGLYVKLEKREFLGFIISPEGIRMDPDRVKTIVEWSVPKSHHDIQVFLGFTNFYWRFIEGYSRIVLALTNLPRKGKSKEFKWGPKAQEAFNRLKDAFSKEPVKHFDRELQ